MTEIKLTKKLQKIANELIRYNEADLGNHNLSIEDGMSILRYIFDKIHFTYKLIINENVYSTYINYDCYIADSDTFEVVTEYWPCYAR